MTRKIKKNKKKSKIEKRGRKIKRKNNKKQINNMKTTKGWGKYETIKEIKVQKKTNNKNS